ARMEVRLYASFLTGAAQGDSLTLRAELSGWNWLGEAKRYGGSVSRIAYRPWMTQALTPLSFTLPQEPAGVVLPVRLLNAAGVTVPQNFTTFIVEGGGVTPDTVRLASGRRARVARVPATEVRAGRWSLKQWTVLGDRKLNGAGSGYFEYRIPWPAGLTVANVESATFI